MPGVPTSKACEACRKQKKRCDGQQPACGRCQRLQLSCVGNGVKRFNFKHEGFQVIKGRAHAARTPTTPPPRPGPCNAETQLNNRLVFALQVDDIRYDIMTYGTFVLDLPRHVGSSPVVDASIAALISSFHVMKDSSAKPEALARHINAVSALRTSLQDKSMACTTSTMTAIWLIYVCKMMNGANDQSVSHGEVLAHLVYEAARQGQLNSIDPMLLQLLASAVVSESFFNPRIRLDQEFWDIIGKHGLQRPSMNEKGRTILSVEPHTVGEISYYPRDTEKYLYQLRCAYETLLGDHPVLAAALERAVKNASEPGTSLRAHRISVRYHIALGMVLAMACTVNRVLRIYDGDTPDLVITATQLVDDSLAIAESCVIYRPIPSSFVPIMLTAMWASTPDGYRQSEIEIWIMTYQSDFPAEDHMATARDIKGKYRKIEENWFAKMLEPCMIDDDVGLGNPDHDLKQDGCVIL